jgi:hypothetical protein
MEFRGLKFMAHGSWFIIHCSTFKVGKEGFLDCGVRNAECGFKLRDFNFEL